jgi:phenylacetate-CoA ligase
LTHVTLACLAWRWQTRAERRSGSDARAARLAVLEAGEPPHASTPLFDVATGPAMQTVVIPAAAPFEEVLAAVRNARPTHLVGYASVVGRLARASIAGELSIRPIRVSTNSEPLSEEDRDAIDTAWHVPVHNLWGSTEIGVQAVGCGVSDGLHVCADEVILERVDDAGRPVGPDDAATRTLATGLAGRTFPFIRYDLGDEVTLLPEPCACGSAMPRVATIAGRRDDDFRYGDRMVPASAFRYVLGTDPLISEYQVRQTAVGADVLVVGSPDIPAVVAALTSSLRRFGLANADITVNTWSGSHGTPRRASSSGSSPFRVSSEPQHEQLDVLRRGCACVQGQPAGALAEDQVQQAKQHDHDRAGSRGNADRRCSRPQAHF